MLPLAGVPLLFRLLALLEETGFLEAVVAIHPDDAVTLASFWIRGEESSNPEPKSDLHPLHPYRLVSAPIGTTKDTKADTIAAASNKDGLSKPQSHSVNGTSPGETHPLPLTVLSSKKMKLTLLQLSAPCSGAAGALRQVEAQGIIPPSSHVLVVPGDLVMALNSSQQQPLRDFIHMHRTGSSAWRENQQQLDRNQTSSLPPVACSVLLSNVGQVDEHGRPLKESAKQKRGLLSRDEEEIDYVAIDDRGRLVWKQPKLDIEEDKDQVGSTPKLNFPKARLSRSTRIGKEWNDVHCYVLSPWVRRLVVTKAASSIQSLRYDLIPLLVSRQWRGAEATFGSKVAPDTIREALQSFSSANCSPHVGPLSLEAGSESVSAQQAMDNTTVAKAPLEYSVLAHVNQAPVFRSHTIPSYMYANREVTHAASIDAAVHIPTSSSFEFSSMTPTRLFLPPGATVKTKFHAIILPNTTVADKATLKSCVIGHNCTIGANCRFNNVVLHDNVTVGDHTILQNTVVASRGIIGEHCNLNDCQVAADTTIPPGTKKKGESLLDDTL